MDERTIQGSRIAIDAALKRFAEWGAKNLIKVTNIGPVQEELRGYFGFMQSVAGQTPSEISRTFGLRETDLAQGAMIYRLARIPLENEFVVRGYTTLPDGLRLPEGQIKDAAGYRVGTGALQYALTKPFPVTYLGLLRPHQGFDIRTIAP
ncbi:hypothetical protein E2493_13945 [Sphingomonas parva]|uniref:Uncharacterized protein n=1 Tax=Sphingomonas parva TaxID=2555898 RepID=A0A4Y8ZNM5_9SPHN|nr:hypothetical protein [Sphingomonas parva]TFI57623.1 hypothetical protein E2493_13945 [Sphingomonas parva]